MLFLDLETVPDETRRHLWGVPDRFPAFLDPKLVTSLAVTDVKDYLDSIKFQDETLLYPHLDQLLHQEQAVKLRSGVIDAIDSAATAWTRKRKELALDPERCRVVAFAYANLVDDVETGFADTVSQETRLLRVLTDQIMDIQVIGYNIAGFDLPVLAARSAMLGVRWSEPLSRVHTLDLMLARYGRYRPGETKGLKELALCYGIEDPEPALASAETHAMTADERMRRARADVELCRKLYRLWEGVFV